MKNKKGQAIEGLLGLVAPLIGVGIVIVVGLLIIAESQTQLIDIEGKGAGSCNASGGSYACNGTLDTQAAISDIPAWLPIIVITVIGAILIGLVARFRGN